VECELVYEDFEGVFPFQNMNADVYMDKPSKTMSKTLI
jgi:hypothetical protein